MRRGKRFALTAIVSLTASIVPVVTAVNSYFQQPELEYSMNELSTYPISYRDGKFALDDIQDSAVLGGQMKMVNLVVRNRGERSVSSVLVRFPVLPADGYLGARMSKSADSPPRLYMFDTQTEWKFRNLMPGDSIVFHLYLKSARSDLANRIEVFDGDGRRAAYHPYLPRR